VKHSIGQKGFSAFIAVLALVVVAGLGLGGWYVWDRNKNTIGKPDGASLQTSGKEKQTDEIDSWTSVTTQDNAFSMKVPDGWSLVNYPNDFLGSISTVHKLGIPATIESSDTEYVGHSLRFRASMSILDDAGLGPQWTSPQLGLTESAKDFSIGRLQGKRFKGVFSGDLNQTLYEYVFDIGGNKKLDIVYAIYHDEGETDDVTTVEKAIKTITIN
jgi:hypothetical protein